MTNGSEPSIAAVVVTYNRLPLLKECIGALRSQTRRLDEIIVVNNGSTDGTDVWLRENPDLTVISQANSGSSGGQYSGIKAACEKSHDWVWCMDDDTVPTCGALEQLLACHYVNRADTGFVASLVLWTDGSVHAMNFPGALGTDWARTVLTDMCIPVPCASFVSVMVRREAVQLCGLPLRDLFIWGDDSEFTSRIARKYRGYLALQSTVVHKTGVNAGTIPQRGLKYCYGVRNRIMVIRTSDTPVRRRFLGICSVFLHCAYFGLQRRVDMRSLLWAVKGLFFTPRVEYPANGIAKATEAPL